MVPWHTFSNIFYLIILHYIYDTRMIGIIYTLVVWYHFIPVRYYRYETWFFRWYKNIVWFVIIFEISQFISMILLIFLRIWAFTRKGIYPFTLMYKVPYQIYIFYTLLIKSVIYGAIIVFLILSDAPYVMYINLYGIILSVYSIH